eukprot:7047368-Pyramimonas_sp.AAC.1
MSAAAAGCSCASVIFSAAPRAVPLSFSTSFDARLCATARDDAVCIVVCHFVKNEIVSRVAVTVVEIAIGVDAGVAGAGVGEVGEVFVDAGVADAGAGEVVVGAGVVDAGVGEVGVDACVADAGVGE